MLKNASQDKEPLIRDGTRGKQKQINHPMGIYISRAGTLSERGDREAKVGGWMVRGLIIPLCREGTTERERPTGRRDLVGRRWGRGQKRHVFAFCLKPRDGRR